MNKQIEKLIDGAKLTAVSEMFEDEVVKFAELIVKKCISIAQDRAAFDWAPPNDVNHVIDEIKEHFGVEECSK